MTKTSTWESAVTVGIIALSALANLALVSATRLHIRPNNEEPMNLINVGKKEIAPEGEARSTPQTGGCRFSSDCDEGEDCRGSVWDRILKKGACRNPDPAAETEPVVTEREEPDGETKENLESAFNDLGLTQGLGSNPLPRTDAYPTGRPDGDDYYTTSEEDD